MEHAVGSVFLVPCPFRFSFDPSLVCHSITASLFLFLFPRFLFSVRMPPRGASAPLQGSNLRLWVGHGHGHGSVASTPQSEIFAATDLNNPAPPSSLQHIHLTKRCCLHCAKNAITTAEAALGQARVVFCPRGPSKYHTCAYCKAQHSKCHKVSFMPCHSLLIDMCRFRPSLFAS